VNCGFLLLDKPETWTTFDLIRDLRKKSRLKKFGHMGTLDPFATGLVIVALDKATRLTPLLIGKDKEYLVEIELGTRTDTGDNTGEVVESRMMKPLSKDLLELTAREMLDIREQIPPLYSAVKVSGKPAYKLARAGESAELKKREIKIHSFEILEANDKEIRYRTKVSKGTYIRTLSETFAEKLGTVAFTKKLRRLAIGESRVTAAVRPEKIDQDNWLDNILPVEDILSDIPRIFLTREEALSFQHGNRIMTSALPPGDNVLVFSWDNDFSGQKQLLGWGVFKDKILYPRRVLI
jgi:tRNA pseudouridine55 synthase